MKKTKQSRNRRRFLFKFGLSYYLILAIPFVLVFFTYRTAAGVIIRQSDEEVQSALMQAVNTTEANLQAISTITFSLRKDESVTSFYEKWIHDDEHIFAAYKANHHLPQYNAVNSLIDKVLLYFGKTEEDPHCFVIENGYAMEYYDALTDLMFDNTTLTYSDLNSFMADNSFHERYVSFPTDDPSRRAIYFLSDISPYPYKGNPAVIMIRLSDDFLSDLLDSATLNSSGAAFLLDANNDVIISRNASILPDGFLDSLIQHISETDDTQFRFQDQQVNLVRSPRYGTTFVSVVPVSTVLDEMTHVRNIVLQVSGIFLLFSIVLLSLLTARNSRPVIRILKNLHSVYEEPGQFDSFSDFHFIESAVTDLIQRNQELKGSDAAHAHLYDQVTLGQLLLAENTETPAFQENLKHSTLNLDQKRLIVTYLHIHRFGKGADALSQQLLNPYMQRLKDDIQCELYEYYIDAENQVILITAPDSRNATELMLSIKEAIDRIGGEIEEAYGQHLDFFLSDPVDDHKKIASGYEQCKELALNVIKDHDKYAFSSDDLKEMPVVFHYSLNQEIRLSQLIRYGSEAKLTELLDELYYQNYQLTCLSEGMRQALYDAVRSSLARHLAGFYQEEEIHTLIHRIRHIETFEELRQIIYALQKAMQSRLRQSNSYSNLDEVHSRILDYIQQNYGNANLNLAFLCEDLGINESIATHMFQEMGSSFHVYLENVRIDAACTLLNGGNITIKLVSEQVGYTSDVSFRRAFKRVLGISPSAFITQPKEA